MEAKYYDLYCIELLEVDRHLAQARKDRLIKEATANREVSSKTGKAQQKVGSRLVALWRVKFSSGHKLG